MTNTVIDAMHYLVFLVYIKILKFKRNNYSALQLLTTKYLFHTQSHVAHCKTENYN